MSKPTYYTCQLEIGVIVRPPIFGLPSPLRVLGWGSYNQQPSQCYVSLQDETGNEYDLLVAIDLDWVLLEDGEFVDRRIAV